MRDPREGITPHGMIRTGAANQTLLPQREELLRVADVPALVDAIARLAVRGAPALGVAGAFGVVLAAQAHDPVDDEQAFRSAVATIRSARPTAVNLARGVDLALAAAPGGVASILAAARELRDDEIEASWAMGVLGADLVTSLVGEAVTAMTICNTGGLACVERGTALAVTEEVIRVRDTPIAAPSTDALHPAFDVRPPRLITAIVTDRRVIRLDRGERLENVEVGERRTTGATAARG